MNLISVVATGIRALLMASPDCVTLVGNRAFLGPPPASVGYPLIVMDHIYGAEEFRAGSPSFDVSFAVAAYSYTQPEAEAIANAVHAALRYSKPTYPDDWVAWDYTTYFNLLRETLTVQQKQIFKIGAEYRFRGVK